MGNLTEDVRILREDSVAVQASVDELAGRFSETLASVPGCDYMVGAASRLSWAIWYGLYELENAKLPLDSRPPTYRELLAQCSKVVADVQRTAGDAAQRKSLMAEFTRISGLLSRLDLGEELTAEDMPLSMIAVSRRAFWGAVRGNGGSWGRR